MPSRRGLVFLIAGALLGLDCELVAPLEPLPGRDSGVDTGATEDVAAEVETEVPDARPDGVDRDGPEGDGGDAAPDIAPEVGMTPDAADGPPVTDGGEGGVTPDGRDAGGTAQCDPSMPFGDAIPVYGLNRNLGTEQYFSLASDELTAYLTIGRSIFLTDIHIAKRESTMQPFGSLMPIVSVNSPSYEASLSVTADGLSLFFDSGRSGPSRIFMATRSTIDDQFGSPRELYIRAAGGNEFDPYVLPDGSALYFTADAPPYGFYRAALNGTNPEPPVPVMIAARWPVVSQDELTIYYSVNYVGGSMENLDIMMATRASRDLPFGGSTTLSSLNTTEAWEAPRWISPDGCRLYFTRTLSGEVAISLVAERIHN